MSMINPGSVVFENVRKSFGAFTAIPDLSLTIEPGTLVTLLGPSGCGKTTTLRMLAGLEHPSAGRILIGGKDVTMLPANERDVSMVFQSYALFPHMTSLDNVAYGLQSSGLKRAEARERAEEGLKLVGLAGMGHRLPAELSGGQQQRVAVAARWFWSRRFCCSTNRFPISTPVYAASENRDPRVAAKARLHRRLRDPRPGRGACRLRPDHRHEGWRHCPAGRPARSLRSAGLRLHRRFHG